MRIIRKIRGNGERGQGFMELAISLVFLLILVSVVIELGWAFYEMIALRDAAQEAASYASICPPLATDTTTDPPTGNTARIWDRLRLSATTPLDTNDILYSNVTIQMLQAGTQNVVTTPALGNSIRITVVYGHKIKAPFVGTFIGAQNYNLTVTVTDTILRKTCVADD